MCTSSGRDQAFARERESGFTMVELVVGLSLIMLVAVAALTGWRAIERTTVTDTDRMVRLAQGRVAVARFERDIRLATALGSGFQTCGALLEAGPKQVVFLTRSELTGAPVLVEWELVGGSLMRRRGPGPLSPPAVFSHSLFVDHKTMMEGMTGASRFAFFERGVEVLGPVSGDRLWRIDEVRLLGGAIVEGRSHRTVNIVGGCLVGRR